MNAPRLATRRDGRFHGPSASRRRLPACWPLDRPRACLTWGPDSWLSPTTRRSFGWSAPPSTGTQPTDPYVNFESQAAGRHKSGESKLRAGDKHVSLRLRRQGDWFFASFSRDGVNWTELPVQNVTMPSGVKIGVAAVTSSACTV